MPAPKPVLVVGSANLDLVFSCDRFPQPGETLLGGTFATHPGGKGANQAVAAGRLGGEVYFCGCVGDDPYGGTLRSSLEGAGVDLAHLQSTTHPTGTACILVDAQGNNEIVVAPGSNSDVSSVQVEQALAACGPAVVLAQLEIPLDAVTAASRAEFFILNPAPAQRLPDSLLAACTILTPNESELAGLTGMTVESEAEVQEAAQFLLAKGVQNVIVTLGAKGCLWVSRDGARRFPSRRVEAVDTTAAGDAFNGALAHFLAQGASIADAIPRASAFAALSVTRRGAQESMPSREEFEDFYGPV